MVKLVALLIPCLLCTLTLTSCEEYSTRPCTDLLMGQYICDQQKINDSTQHAEHCQLREGLYLAEVDCYPAPGVQCNGRRFDGETVGFNKTTPCRPSSEKSFETALLLSIFLGMFGVDRFYLGYPALGLLKLSTFGFMLVGQLVDIVLIASQVVKPADGGEYIIDYYGPRLIELQHNTSFPVP